MDIKEIRRIVKLVETSKIDELEIHEKDFQIRVTKSGSTPAALHPGPSVQTASPPPAPVSLSAPPLSAQASAPSSVPDNLVEIKAPMVGTFYHAPSPDAEPYVKEGDSIQPGRVLCIIEAMKLMNEIEAEISGRIVKIMVENAEPVEYDQPLFLIEKA